MTTYEVWKIAQATSTIARNSNIATGVLIQTPLIVGGALVHTYYCVEPDERPESYFTTGLICILIGCVANAAFFYQS